jgi:hypothetical protein
MPVQRAATRLSAVQAGAPTPSIFHFPFFHFVFSHSVAIGAVPGLSLL